LEKRIGVGMPKVLENCKVCVANCQMDTDKIKIYGARVKVDNFEAVAEIEAAERDKMKAKVAKIAAHGCNVFINRQLIYNYPEQLFKEQGIMAIEHSDFDGTERLAAVLGSDIISTFDRPEETNLGFCEKIEEIMIGEDKVIKFSGCRAGEACSIVLRGASSHILDEAERSLHDALAVLFQTVTETRVVHGGGAMEVAMGTAVLAGMADCDGKESLAMEQFAKAMMQLPCIMADNGGLDSAELLGQLRSAHARGEHTTGLNFKTGTTGNMKELGIMESFRSKMSQLCAAAEAAEMIIRVDDIIRNVPRQREG
jgi:T-complex protein 1 subunit beta